MTFLSGILSGRRAAMNGDASVRLCNYVLLAFLVASSSITLSISKPIITTPRELEALYNGDLETEDFPPSYDDGRFGALSSRTNIVIPFHLTTVEDIPEDAKMYPSAGCKRAINAIKKINDLSIIECITECRKTKTCATVWFKTNVKGSNNKCTLFKAKGKGKCKPKTMRKGFNYIVTLNGNVDLEAPDNSKDAFKPAALFFGTCSKNTNSNFIGKAKTASLARCSMLCAKRALRSQCDAFEYHAATSNCKLLKSKRDCVFQEDASKGLNGGRIVLARSSQEWAPEITMQQEFLGIATDTCPATCNDDDLDESGNCCQTNYYTNEVSWTRDGAFIATAGKWELTAAVRAVDQEDGTIIDTAEENLQVTERHNSAVERVEWSPTQDSSGNYLLGTADLSGAANIWKVNKAGVIDPNPQVLSTETKITPYMASILSAAWSPDGSLFAAGCFWTGLTIVWRVGQDGTVDTKNKNKQVLEATPGKTPTGDSPPTSSVLDLAFSPDGKYLATLTAYSTRNDEARGTLWIYEVGQDGTIDTANRKELVDQSDTLLRGGRAVAWSPDTAGGYKLAVANFFGYVVVHRTDEAGNWDTQDEQYLMHATCGCSITGVSWSPDGARLAASASNGNAKVWMWDEDAGMVDTRSVQLLAPRANHYQSHLDWSPPGTTYDPVLATTSGPNDKTIRIWGSDE